MIEFDIILAFLAGLVLGSFYNVCIYRLPRNQSLVFPGSHCPHCQKKLKWSDNVPIVSYILLRGKCRYCNKPIHWRYPVIEALTGLLFAAAIGSFGFTLAGVKIIILLSLLLIISAIDLEFTLILNKLTIPGIVVGTSFSLAAQHLSILKVSMGIIGGGGLLLLISLFGQLLFKKESMGMGDVKLGAMIGAFLGFQAAAVSIFFGFLLAAVVSLVGMASGRLSRSSYVPFGPFIAGGTLIYVFWGEGIILWYLHTVGLQ